MCDVYCSELVHHVKNYVELVHHRTVLMFYDLDSGDSINLTYTPFGGPRPRGKGPSYNVDDTDDAKVMKLSAWDLGFLQLGKKLCTLLKEEHDVISALPCGPANGTQLVCHREVLFYIEALSKRVDDARLSGIQELGTNINLRTNCVDLLKRPSSPDCTYSPMYSPTSPTYERSVLCHDVGPNLKVRKCV
jgi:hypothetical protein